MSSVRRPHTTYKEKTMLNLLHVYTSPNHGSSVLRYWPVTHMTHSHLRPIWPMTHDPLTHCLLWCLYDATLWSTYNSGTISKLAARYNRCIKTYFNFRRRESATQILFNLGQPSFDTVLHNCKANFQRTWLNSTNSSVSHVRQILGC